MKKLIMTAVAIFAISTSAIAGGLLTNTNQNAVFLRNPSRDAVIAIDGVYSNPAGTAFLEKGLHLSLSWQAAWQTREITSTFPTYALNAYHPGESTRFYKGESVAPVIPSVQMAYIFNDKWSISAQFAVGGGGGKCEFDNGLPMFEKLVGGQLGNQIAPGKPYTMIQNLVGKQYFYGIQVGGTYKFNDNISVFGGVRGVIANCQYEGSISGIAFDVQPIDENNLIGPGKDAAYYLDIARKATAVGQHLKSYRARQTAFLLQDYVLDCTQSGFGVQPIIGINAKLGNWNLAAKYEFRGVINLENESKNSANVNAMFANYADGARVRSDIPALATVGAQYSFSDKVRAMAGFHYFFDKDAKGAATEVSDNTWELTFGLEWDITKKFTFSAGVQRTDYGFYNDDMNDLTFNNSSTALCVGASYRVSKTVNINAGYMHSFYDDLTVTNAMGRDNYNRKNDVVGVSVDLKF